MDYLDLETQSNLMYISDINDLFNYMEDYPNPYFYNKSQIRQIIFYYSRFTNYHILYLKLKYKHFKCFDDYMVINITNLINIENLNDFKKIYKWFEFEKFLDLKLDKKQINLNIDSPIKYYKCIYRNPSSLQNILYKYLINKSINISKLPNSQINYIKNQRSLNKKYINNINKNINNKKLGMDIRYEILKSIRSDILSDTQLIISNKLFKKFQYLDDYIINLSEDIYDWYKD